MKILWGVRTNFSTGESILKADSLFKRAAALDYTHVAIADTMSVTALIDAASHAKKAGVELISGCTMCVSHWDKPGYLFNPKVYCKDDASFNQLLKCLSAAQINNKFATITWERFIEMLTSADYLVTTGDAASVFSSAFPAADVDEFVERLRTAQTRCESDIQLAIELIAVRSPYYKRVNDVALQYISASAIPYIISGMSLYEEPDQAEARDVMHAITRNLKLTHGARQILEGTDCSMKDEVETQDILGNIGLCFFQDEMVKSLAWRWSKMPVSLPKMADDEFQALVDLCKAGWAGRIGSPVLGFQPDKAQLPEYVARLKYELNVLKDLGFCNYFLLVAELVQWSKDNDIIVGPGRGSVGGSLIAFLVGITDVDPIRFNLLFERFINPERLDLPDADLDFMSARRHEVVDFLSNKYGHDCVAHISNYNALGPASAIGEVGKAFDVPDRDMGFKSFLPKLHGQAVPLADCVNLDSALEEYTKQHPHEYKISLELEGQLRSLGTHAAGVVVSAIPLNNRAVVVDRAGDHVVNWDKRVVEDMGLVKIDILGLTNLDVIGRAISKIDHDYGKKINMLDLPLDDEKILECFGRGETVGVFQFEGGGMRKLLKDLRKGGPLTFEDLAAATALFRPGPLDSGMTADYVAVRQGLMTPQYDHPVMEKVLGETNGALVYQESTMRLSRDLCGYSGAEADNLRKIIGKKDKDKMRSERQKFVAGAMAGFIKVKLDNGETKTVHRHLKFLCADGKRRTPEDAVAANTDITQW